MLKSNLVPMESSGKRIHPGNPWAIVLASIGLGILSLTGCQTLKIPEKMPWVKEEKPAVIDHILAVWTEAVHSQTGKPAQRGFGGRMIFFDAQEKPIEVDGKLTIFVFDDHNINTQDPAAKYKFVFPAEVLPQHFSKSDLGPSYSFWVPLADGNAPTQHFSLVAKFESIHGETVLSSLTKKVMVGSGAAKVAKETPVEKVDGEVRPVSYQEFAAAKNAEQPSLGREIRSETIELTPSFSQRLAKTTPVTNTDANATIPSVSGTGVPERGVPINAERIDSIDRGQPDRIEQRPDNFVQPASFDAGATTNDSRVMVAGGSSTGSVLSQSQAPSGQLFPPNETAPRREPHRAGWLSGLPPTPRSGFQMERTMSDRSTSELSRRAEQWFRAQAGNPSSEADPVDR